MWVCTPSCRSKQMSSHLDRVMTATALSQKGDLQSLNKLPFFHQITTKMALTRNTVVSTKPFLLINGKRRERIGYLISWLDQRSKERGLILFKSWRNPYFISDEICLAATVQSSQISEHLDIAVQFYHNNSHWNRNWNPVYSCLCVFANHRAREYFSVFVLWLRRNIICTVRT